MGLASKRQGGVLSSLFVHQACKRVMLNVIIDSDVGYNICSKSVSELAYVM